jgi:hypothetical protein
MEFYIIIVPALIISIIAIIDLRNMAKHDKVLFAFCQNRRDLMAIIREKNFSLSRQDYYALRDLTEFTGETIHHFNDFKPYLFNLRRFIEYVLTVKDADESLKERHIENQEIAKLYSHFVRIMLTAFFTFTPFIKSELAIRACVFLLKAIARVGGRYLKYKAKKLVEVLVWVEHEADQHNFSLKSDLSLNLR